VEAHRGRNNWKTIIGLKYDNFKRTVIIPQGRLQEFLQLGNHDRTK
jgi:exonuclease SbcC